MIYTCKSIGDLIFEGFKKGKFYGKCKTRLLPPYTLPPKVGGHIQPPRPQPDGGGRAGPANSISHTCVVYCKYYYTMYILPLYKISS